MRRALVCLLSAALLAWAAAPALSTQPWRPKAVDFELRLDRAGTTAKARAAGHGWRSGTIRAPKRFDLVGLRWKGEERHAEDDHGRDDVAAQIRFRKRGGKWGRWVAAGHGHGAAGTDPIWVGGADAFQLRMDERPRGLRAHFVNVSGSTTGVERVKTAVRGAVSTALVTAFGAPDAQAAPAGRPNVVTRAQWGADQQCRPRDAPGYGEVKFGAVHHTVSANDYSREQAKAVVLAICRYHRNGNGWDDIGYNFLVDQYGQVFEGRAGGIDKAVVGAHAQGFNATSTGVAALGTYDAVRATDPQVSAIASVLAWKLPQHGSPVTGTVTVESAGGSANRFPRGQKVTLPRITGHRDTGETACPGSQLYQQLPGLRALAADRQAPIVHAARQGGLTLEDPAPTSYPRDVVLRGALTAADGTARPGVGVTIQRRTGKGWRDWKEVTTRADGTYELAFRTMGNKQIRAIGGGETSQHEALEVAPELTLAITERARRGERVRVRGRSRPMRATMYLYVARPGSDGRFHTVARVRADSRRGRVDDTLRFQRDALTRVRLVFRGDRHNARGHSQDAYVCVGPQEGCEDDRRALGLGGEPPAGAPSGGAGPAG